MYRKVCSVAASLICLAVSAQDIILEQHVAKYWTQWRGKKVEVSDGHKYYPVTPELKAERLAHFKAILMRFAPHIVEECSRIDKVFNWKPDTYLGVARFGAKVTEQKPPHECTSWVVMDNLTDGKSIIMHKNRDSSGRHLTLMRRAVPGKHAWIGNGALQSLFPTQGINDRGLVIMMNSGEAQSNADNSQYGLGTPIIARILLEECATAEDAVAHLKKIVLSNGYTHFESGSIWFIGDKENVFIVEQSSRKLVAKKVASGAAVRANIYDYPEMQMFATTKYKDKIGNSQRAYTVLDFLINKAWRQNGIVTPLDSAAASRISTIEDAPKVYPPCGKATISATTFVIDKDYPEYLSTAYMVFSNPGSSCYLPVPLCVRNIPVMILDGSFSTYSFDLKDQKKPFLPPEELAALEKKLYARHAAAQEKARMILRTSRKYTTWDEAAKLLNDAFEQNVRDIQAAMKKSAK